MEQSQAPSIREGNFSHDRRIENAGGEGPQTDGDGARPRSHTLTHTLTACCRCRSRKTKCDPGLPRCSNCERSNSTCDYLDTTKGKTISRLYIIHLQKKVHALQNELDRLSQEQYEPPDADVMVRRGGYVRVKEKDESRYLGPSSGIAVSEIRHHFASKRHKS